MFVKNMHADDWQNESDVGVSVNDPTWDMVRHAILQLNGNNKTMTVLAEREDGDHQMIIAGQWDGRCLVNATVDSRNFFSLVDASRSKKQQILFVGGQNGDYEERKCVPVEWALEAAQAFYENGELKKSLPWESDR